MAYLKPAFLIKKVLNPIAMRFGFAGAKTLEVAGRSSGGPRRVPLVPFEYEAATYLVSPRGETDWVRNLRAASGEAEFAGESVRATEVSVEERPPILAAFQQKTGRTVQSYFKKLPDPADHPTFRMEAR